MTTVPPCAGKWELFDSNHPREHHQARTLCASCPVVAACLAQLEMARAASHVPNTYGPSGTWAGRLIGPAARTTESRARAEEEMFTDQELRAEHAAFAAGFRTPRTILGERIYQRKSARAKRASRSSERAA